ncbi:MAG: hypothetical protein A3J74_03180 [Elusimicrobia bacterium RIFCSPHIGHO2_02_FULL_57_9]|nr:MAG: hypothetical protein A3J74_03180 [Elusimicrobia bacterium RIFCSPHIGHO2_02_FULL_57_9]
MLMISQFGVYFASLAAAVFAGLMIGQKSLYAAAVCLLAVLLQAAALFFFMGASLLAFLQVMIYAGAVMALVVIAIMTAPTPVAAENVWSRLALPKPLIAAVFILPFLEIAALIMGGGLPAGIAGNVEALQARLGSVLFGPYAAATEAVTLLMLISALAVIDQ